MIWHDTIRYEVVRSDITRCGITRYDMIRYDAIRCDKNPVWYITTHRWTSCSTCCSSSSPTSSSTRCSSWTSSPIWKRRARSDNGHMPTNLAQQFATSAFNSSPPCLWNAQRWVRLVFALYSRPLSKLCAWLTSYCYVVVRLRPLSRRIRLVPAWLGLAGLGWAGLGWVWLYCGVVSFMVGVRGRYPNYCVVCNVISRIFLLSLLHFMLSKVDRQLTKTIEPVFLVFSLSPDPTPLPIHPPSHSPHPTPTRPVPTPLAAESCGSSHTVCLGNFFILTHVTYVIVWWA